MQMDKFMSTNYALIMIMNYYDIEVKDCILMCMHYTLCQISIGSQLKIYCVHIYAMPLS